MSTIYFFQNLRVWFEQNVYCLIVLLRKPPKKAIGRVDLIKVSGIVSAVNGDQAIEYSITLDGRSCDSYYPILLAICQ